MSYYRLLIDSVVFDSREGGTPTIAGTVLGFGDGATGALWEEDETSIRFPFRIRVAASTNASLLDAVEDVIDALDVAAQKGATLEDELGNPVLDFDLAALRSLTVNKRVEVGPAGAESGAILECEVSATKLDIDSLAASSTWSYQRNSSGRAFCVGRIRAATRAAAVAAAAPLRSGAARPVWMPSSMVVIEDTSEFEASPGNPTALLDSDFRPAEVVVVFEQKPSWVASDSAFSDVKRVECRFVAVPRAPLHDRAGNQPGLDVSITATLYFRTEASTVYDVADTGALSGSVLAGKAEACAASIKAEAERRLGEGVITLLAPLEKSVTGEDGVYQIAMAGVTGGPARVLFWDESDLYEETAQDEDLDIFDGSVFEFQKPALCTIQHSLDIVSLGSARGYVKPLSLSRRPGAGAWKQVYAGDFTPKRLVSGQNSEPQFASSFRRNYKFKRRGAAGGGSGGSATVATP